MDELLASCWTTAGDTGPHRTDQRSPWPLRTRVEAAAAAGFTGFGLLYEDLLTATEDLGLPGVRALLQDNGMTHVELEMLHGWWADGAERRESDLRRRTLLTAAEALDARHLKVGPDLANRPWDPDHWAAEFATLSAHAADAGTRIAFEFLPWTNIRSLDQALNLVQAADAPAGGLMVDIWHTERTHTPLAAIAALPPHHITAVELNDGSATLLGTHVEDTVHRRRPCGQGAFDVSGFVEAVRSTGWKGPWGVEILSDELRRMPVAEAVTTAYESAVRALA